MITLNRLSGVDLNRNPYRQLHLLTSEINDIVRNINVLIKFIDVGTVIY